jgi:hypothetical protein
MSAITIGTAIFNILSNDSGVQAITKNIYPLILPENTTLPAIIYERKANIEYSRDGAGINTSTIDITAIATDYIDSVNMAQAIYNALNMYTNQNNGNSIFNIRLESMEESFYEMAFLQKMTFTCKSI